MAHHLPICFVPVICADIFPARFWAAAVVAAELFILPPIPFILGYVGSPGRPFIPDMLGGNGEAIVEDIKGWPELSPARDTPPGPDIAEENGGKPKKPGARSNPAAPNMAM